MNNNTEVIISRNTMLECQVKELKQIVEDLRDENTQLQSELDKCRVIDTCENSPNYEIKYYKLKEDLVNAKKVIKYLSKLL